MRSETAAERVIIVSNRLPVSARRDGHELVVEPSQGGLATGLGAWYEHGEALWVGWPGDVSSFSASERRHLETVLSARRIRPVYLSRQQVDEYYEGFCNGVVWPLFHYLIDRVPLDTAGWEAYCEVNELYADAVAAVYRPGDLVWIHDYQLMLLPALLRYRLPGARIGFFLHIPFPSSEVFRVLPWRHQILQGLLGADLLGFHTFGYLRHFATCLVHLEGIETDIDHVVVGDRRVSLGVFPMSVDAVAFSQIAETPEVRAASATIRRAAGGRQIIVGVDRLDYTKGISRRLVALERLFGRVPDLRDAVRYVQVAVPSRGDVESYKRFRREVEETVGRINGSCSTLRSTPIQYIHRSISRSDLVSLYCAADVMLVTPLRDGMNLVAKEFVASRVDGDGVLILSELAGAASELGDAVTVNAYDADAVGDAIERALGMPAIERTRRMNRLRAQVMSNDVAQWAAAFIHRLQTEQPPLHQAVHGDSALARVIEEAARAPHLYLLLDYDGTLVPIADAPEHALPDAATIALIKEASECPGVDVHIVSGRPRQFLDEWFARLRLALWAEHGFWRRPSGSRTWEAAAHTPPAFLDRIRPILNQFTSNTPGARIEQKTASLAWHYRQADPEFGVRQAHELRMLLGDVLSNQPLEVLDDGKKVVEVRLRGISKALVALRTSFPRDAAVIAIGDDASDEDLFRALPPSAITIAVGTDAPAAKYRVGRPDDVRALIRSITLTRRMAILASSEAGGEQREYGSTRAGQRPG